MTKKSKQKKRTEEIRSKTHRYEARYINTRIEKSKLSIRSRLSKEGNRFIGYRVRNLIIISVKKRVPLATKRYHPFYYFILQSFIRIHCKP